MDDTTERRPALGRRSFTRFGGGLAALGLAGIPVAQALAQDASADAPADAPMTAMAASDADILNFALNLEYLEAEYYLRAIGRRLADSDTTGMGTRGAVVGGRQVNFTSGVFRQYAEEIANDELAHVKFLRGALGSARVARPAINFTATFNALGQAAGLGNFDPFANQNAFLLGAFVFEDVGVTAYKGAAPLLDSKAILAAAAGILAVEAYHAGEIRTLLIANGLGDEGNKISDVRDQLDGAGDKDQGPLRAGRVNVVPTNANGLVFTRSTTEVLRIVYAGGADKGGFFPNGLNGAIA